MTTEERAAELLGIILRLERERLAKMIIDLLPGPEDRDPGVDSIAHGWSLGILQAAETIRAEGT